METIYKNAEERAKIKEFFTNPNSNLQPHRKTIVFATPSETGTSFFRLFEPMLAIYRKHPEKYNLIYTESIQPFHFEIADLLIVHRASDQHQYFTNLAKYWPKHRQEIIVIHDVDDNEFNLPSSHPMKTMWVAAGKDKMSLNCLKNSKWITTTATELARIFKQINPNVKIFRNQFNFNLPQWTLEKQTGQGKYEGKVVIGWAGLTSHLKDIENLSRILKPIYEKYPQTHFIFAGMALKDTVADIEIGPNGERTIKEREVTDPTQGYRARVRDCFKYMSDDRIELLDAVGLEEYGKFFTLFDISLTFIENNTFNKSKSEIKVIESMFYECAPVFSSVGPYYELYSSLMPTELKNDNIIVNSNTDIEWRRKIEYWIENYNTPESKKYLKQLKDWVYEYYHIDNRIDERVDFYDQLLQERDDHEIIKFGGDQLLFDRGKL